MDEARTGLGLIFLLGVSALCGGIVIWLIVTEGIHDRFVEAVVARIKGLKIDDALAAGTEIGPVVVTRIEKKSAMTRRVVLGFAA